METKECNSCGVEHFIDDLRNCKDCGVEICIDCEDDHECE